MSTSDHQQDSSPLSSLWREPTLHFFLMALVIFLLYWIANRGNNAILEIDQREIDARIFMQELNTGEELTPEQQEFIRSSFIEEQILVQEALALGLDNDARIHDMLAQKMRHVLSGNIIQPTDAELQAYYERNLERYRTPAALDVNELVFDSREELPAEILDNLNQGADADSILQQSEGSASSLPNVSELDLRNIFDADLAQSAFAANSGDWVGPFISNRGQHWLQISNRTPERLAPLDEVRDRVRLEWINQEEEIRLQEEVAKLWEKYSIIITDSEEAEH